MLRPRRPPWVNVLHGGAANRLVPLWVKLKAVDGNVPAIIHVDPVMM